MDESGYPLANREELRLWHSRRGRFHLHCPFTSTAYIRSATCLPDPASWNIKDQNGKGSAFIDFPVNVTAIHKEFSNNVIELNKIIETINTVKNDSNVSITRISIHGYASPDGPLQLNERLARERTRTLKEYVSQLYPFDGKYIHTTYTPEDWEGFEALLSDTTFQDKEAIMKIVTSNMHPDRKEEIIRIEVSGILPFCIETLVCHTETFRLYRRVPRTSVYNRRITKSIRYKS